jgi:hypothetical protein
MVAFSSFGRRRQGFPLSETIRKAPDCPKGVGDSYTLFVLIELFDRFGIVSDADLKALSPGRWFLAR